MWERTQHTHTYLRKQTRAHTYAQKLTYTRNEEIKVWPLSAALISSCRLYLLNLLFLALIPSLHGVQPRANPRSSPHPPSRHSTVRCFAFRTPTRFVSFSSRDRRARGIARSARPTGSETGSNGQVTEDRSECISPFLFIDSSPARVSTVEFPSREERGVCAYPDNCCTDSGTPVAFGNIGRKPLPELGQRKMRIRRDYSAAVRISSSSLDDGDTHKDLTQGLFFPFFFFWSFIYLNDQFFELWLKKRRFRSVRFLKCNNNML